MEMLNKKQKMLVIGGVICICIIIIFYYINSTKEVYISDEAFESNEINVSKEEEKNQNTIIVHVTGAVKNQGIAMVKEDARINDVIEAAGGLTEEADLSNVNLAYVIEDGQKIYIPYKIDGDENIDDGEITTQGAGEGVAVQDEGKSKNGLININTASQEMLQQLPGIGSSTALKIITYRTENGNFKSIQDIKNVSGIGDAKYESIKDYICI